MSFDWESILTKKAHVEFTYVETALDLLKNNDEWEVGDAALRSALTTVSQMDDRAAILDFADRAEQMIARLRNMATN